MKDGRTYLIDQYCSLMKNYLGLEVYLACFGLEKAQPDYFTEVYGLREPSIVEMGLNVVLKTFISRQWPIQTSMMYSRSTKKRLLSIIETIKPDIIICDMIRTAPYVHGVYTATKKILDIDDLLSKRYWRQAKLKHLDEDVLGQMKDRVPLFIIRLVKKLNLMRLMLKYEATLMEKYEKNEAKAFDEVFFCSPQDMKDFNKMSNIKAKCVHVAVDVDKFSTKKTTGYDKHLIGYIGNIDIAANKDNVRYLINNVLPEVRKINKDFRLLVIGKCSEQNYKELCVSEGVEFTLYVDDIKEYLKNCLAIVAPIQYGSGIKIKIIESMAMKIPVITNNLGIEGINVIDEHDVLICNDVKEFVDSILLLSNNSDKRNEIANNGYEYVVKNHTLQRSATDLKEVLMN